MFPTSPRGSERSSTLPPPWVPPLRVPFNNFKTPNGGTHPKCFTGYQKRTRKAHPKTPESTRSHPTAPEMLVKLITFAPERHPKHFEHYHFLHPKAPKVSCSCGGCENGSFHNLRSCSSGGCENGSLHNLRNCCCGGCENGSFHNLRKESWGGLRKQVV